MARSRVANSAALVVSFSGTPQMVPSTTRVMISEMLRNDEQ